MKITIEIENLQELYQLQHALASLNPDGKNPIVPMPRVAIEPDAPIATLGLPTMVVNALTHAGIHDVRVLCATTALELRRLDQIGKGSLTCIKEALHARGLRLADEH